MIGIADLHSHILPGIDDGSRSLEESLVMLSMEADQGVGVVAATPHFDPRRDSPEAFLDRRNAAAQALTRAMGEDPRLPRILLGAEVRYCPGISQWDALPQLTLEGGKALLLEMPGGPWNEELCQELSRIASERGITPVIAHVERCLRPSGNESIFRTLEELPVLAQANSSFFCNIFTARRAMGMLRAGWIHLLGSDCHSSSRRKPDLIRAVNRIGRREQSALEAIWKHQKHILPHWTENALGETEIRV